MHFSTLLQLKVLDERIRHRRVQAALSSLYPGVSSLRYLSIFAQVLLFTSGCSLGCSIETNTGIDLVVGL